MGQMSRQYSELTREPCPVCGHQGRCKADPARECILCFRETVQTSNGYRFIKRTGECAKYRREDAAANFQTGSSQNDWERKSKRFVASISREQLGALADQLHVTKTSLEKVGVGWCSDRQCYTFPECDAHGNVIGIATRRSTDGTKKALRGSKRGLTVPPGLDATKPLLIVEGTSDVASALSVGLQAVGRPSARGGVAHLYELLTSWTGETIVVGENDRKVDGKWPGRDGAKAVSLALTTRLASPIRFALPPEGLKDLREWVTQDVQDFSDEA